MSRLVVMSNRGPLRPVRRGRKIEWERSTGGLVTALDPVLTGRGGVWVSGSSTAATPPDHPYDLAAVRIPGPIEKLYYGGFSNAILWPVLHSFPSTIRLAEGPWDEYVSANRAFARGALRASGEDDTFWIHDYHMTLVPLMLRKDRPDSRIGWFCHIPWPGADTFRILPWHPMILEGLLGADLLGFHTERFATNFLDCIANLTEHEVDFDTRTVRFLDRTVRVGAFPIGIDVGWVDDLMANPAMDMEAEDVRRSMRDRKVVLGVDRLDYTKGIPERLLAYERTLQRNPHMADEVVFVQVMVPSRTEVAAYASLKNEVDRLVGSINGKYAITGEVPIHYLFQSMDPRQLYVHYRAAHVALVTPLRDGMNLVAHEYVAAHPDGDGVLILSELAGAAEYLTGALVVNPYDLDAVAEAIERALHMDSAEMRERMDSMRRVVTDLDVHGWADRFLAALEGRE
jgi:alpha,alpha-trehalose-phosphate synthase [UDP-forming]